MLVLSETMQQHNEYIESIQSFYLQNWFYALDVIKWVC